MLRISMFVVVTLLLASTAVAARDTGPGATTGETCAEKHEADEKNAAVRASTTRGGVPARETKAKTGAGGDLPGRLQSPRWHSFLPGMFR